MANPLQAERRRERIQVALAVSVRPTEILCADAAFSGTLLRFSRLFL
jgi:hypothetical protein